MAKQPNTIIIDPKNTGIQYWKDIWAYRELFYFFAWRDIIVRFKQKVLGFFWSFARPIFSMIVMSVIFGRLANLPSDGVPYPLMVFAGLLPWQFFTSCVGATTNSIVGSKNLIAKVYFPRLMIPLSKIVVNLIDFAIACLILACLMIWYNYVPTSRILLIPLLLLLVIAASLGMGLMLAALNVRFRDVGDMLPMLLQLGTYMSPVAYSANLIPEKYKLIYSLNPMVGVIDGFRWAIFGGDHSLYMPGLYISIVFTTVWLIVSFKYFRSIEKIFADII